MCLYRFGAFKSVQYGTWIAANGEYFDARRNLACCYQMLCGKSVIDIPCTDGADLRQEEDARFSPYRGNRGGRDAPNSTESPRFRGAGRCS